MAESSSSWNWGDEEVALWRRVGEVGTEVSLRAIGCSKEHISKTLRFLQKADSFDTRNDAVKKVCSIVATKKDGHAVLLATLGRGITWGLRNIYIDGVKTIGLTISDITALCVNLSSNPDIRKLKIYSNQVFGSVQGCTLLAAALRSNTAIQELYLCKCRITSEALKCLMVGLQANKTLIKLVLEENPLEDDGIVLVADFVKSNPQLKVLNVSGTQSGFRGAHQLASALEHNKTLEVLCFGDFCNVDQHCKMLRLGARDGMMRLLEPLSCDETLNHGSSSSGPKNTTLKRLAMSHTNMQGFCVDSLARMIRTNKTLSALKLDQVLLPQEDWQEQIIPALKENETIQELDLGQSKGLTNDIYESLVDLIRSSSTGLKKIELKETDLGEWQARIDAELSFSLEHRGLLISEAPTPTTPGRLVLCGLDLKPCIHPNNNTPSSGSLFTKDQSASRSLSRFSEFSTKFSNSRLMIARCSPLLMLQCRV